MHSALFVAESSGPEEDWKIFLGHIDTKLKQDKDAVRIAENVWLLDVRQSPASLGHLVHYAEANGVVYGILAFENAPEWLPAGFDPTSILAQSERS